MKLSASLLRGVFFSLLSAFVAVPSFAQQGAPARPAVPVEPITAIIEAFESRPVVALAEGAHGNEQGHAFRVSLIRDPRFTEMVDDIVVEFGSARYQSLMDRFVRGEDVDVDLLRHVWEDTTQPHAVWDRPIYEEFFRAVRDVNASLPGEQMLRVLLGDPPVDWDIVLAQPFGTLTGPLGHSEMLLYWGYRDPHAAEVIRREVIEKGRKALVIYGAGHLRRADLALVELVERQSNIRVFTIYTNTGREDLATVQSDIESWDVPSLAMVRGMVLGASGRDVFLVPSGARMEDHFDALLYIGSEVTFSQITAEKCSDSAYMEMRLGRMQVFPEGPIRQVNVDGLKQQCASVAPD